MTCRLISFAFVMLLQLNNTIAQSMRPTVVVNRAFGKALTYSKIETAERLEDFIPSYPSKWIDIYEITSISLNSAGKVTTENGKNNTLTTSQKQMLRKAKTGDQLNLVIRYSAINTVTNKMQSENLEYQYTIVADQEAEPENGHQSLTSFFKSLAFGKLPVSSGAPFIGSAASFTVNEEGKIHSVKLKNSSGNPEADQLLLETIKRMPRWKPAKNKNGKTFAQDFFISVVNEGC